MTKKQDKELYILEVQSSSKKGYTNRFESVKKIVLIRGKEEFELNGYEARQIFDFLKPALMG